MVVSQKQRNGRNSSESYKMVHLCKGFTRFLGFYTFLSSPPLGSSLDGGREVVSIAVGLGVVFMFLDCINASSITQDVDNSRKQIINF